MIVKPDGDDRATQGDAALSSGDSTLTPFACTMSQDNVRFKPLSSTTRILFATWLWRSHVSQTMIIERKGI